MTATPAAPAYEPHEFEPIRTERLLMRRDDARRCRRRARVQSDPEVCRYLLFEPRSRERVTEKITQWSDMGRLAEAGDDIEVALELLDGPQGAA